MYFHTILIATMAAIIAYPSAIALRNRPSAPPRANPGARSASVRAELALGFSVWSSLYSINWGGSFVGVLIVRALLLGICIKPLDFWKFPHELRSIFLGQAQRIRRRTLAGAIT